MRPNLLPLLVLALTLCACAGAEPSASPPTATAQLCPTSDEVAKPPGCIPYDPEANMALNEKYKERMPLTDLQRADAQPFVEAAIAALAPLEWQEEDLQATADQALVDAGFDKTDIQSAGEWGYAFGVAVGPGYGYGCVFGHLDNFGLRVEAGGFIMDGGCLAMEGH